MYTTKYMRKYGVLIFILILIAIGLYQQNASIPKQRHVHAGFTVFVDGKQVDFSNINYMSLMPCKDENVKYSKEEIQDQKAHLHENVGYVAHSHREGAVWNDLFTNMGYKIDTTKGINGYINGEKINDILNYPVNGYDSAVFFVGKENKKLLVKAITKDQILKVDQTSRDCGINDHK